MRKRFQWPHSDERRHTPDFMHDAEAIEFLSRAQGGLKQSMIGYRRCPDRKPFPSTQAVAPVFDEGLPPESAFCTVLCRRISATDIAFYWPTNPDFQTVVVALSDDSRIMHFTARVRHFRAGSWNRKQQFLVGCQYQRRLRYPRQAKRHSRAIARMGTSA